MCVTESLCCIRGMNNIANQLYFNNSKLKQLCCRAQFLTTQRGTNDAPGPQGGEDFPGQGRRAGLGEEDLEGALTFTQSNKLTHTVQWRHCSFSIWLWPHQEPSTISVQSTCDSTSDSTLKQFSTKKDQHFHLKRTIVAAAEIQKINSNSTSWAETCVHLWKQLIEAWWYLSIEPSWNNQINSVSHRHKTWKSFGLRWHTHLISFKNYHLRTSLVLQWMGICQSMQETCVPPLVREDPTCPGATRSGHHSYPACVLQLLNPVCLESVLCNKRGHCQEELPLLTATKESPCTATKVLSSPKKNFFFNDHLKFK